MIPVGGLYDPLEGLTITDDVDSEADLLERLEYYGKFDTTVSGAYEIYYYVEDSDHNVAYLIRPLIVLDPELPLIYAPFGEVELGQPFDLLGNVSAYDLKDGLLTDEIEVVSSDVDTSTVGNYSVVLSVTDTDGNTALATREVYVFWPREYYPVISAEDHFIPLGEEYDLMEGVTATDLTDGDLTGNILLEYSELDPYTPGIYWVQYRVQNSLGLDGYGGRRIIVVDLSSSPVIVTQDTYLETGYEFNPLDHAFAYDVEDGNITDRIEVVDNPVDTTTAGLYRVTFKVADSDGNTAEATMMVQVDWSYENYPSFHLDSGVYYLPLNADFDPMLGVTASDPTDGDLTDQIVMEQLYLDTSVPGEYYVEYSVTNSLGCKAWAQVVIYVLDSSEPVIKAYDFSVDLNSELNLEWIHFEAFDLEDGDLAGAVSWDISAVDVSTAGTYPVTLMVYDSDGNYAEAICYVTVIDRSYPELEVYDHIAYLNSDYNPLDYAYAWDQLDGDLTDQIEIVKSTVKIRKIGTYFVTYSVTNSQGKTTTKTAGVEVMKEPFVSFNLIYDGNLIQLETDETGQMAFLTSPVMIPAGAEVGIGIYADGEPVFEIMGIVAVSDILPGFTYSMMINEENQLITWILPYIYNGIGYRYTAMEGEVQFKSTVEGSIHYAVQSVEAAPPDLYTSGSVVPGTIGQNSIPLDDLDPGKAQMVYVMMENPDLGISNILTIELPKTPGGPNMNKEKPDKPKDSMKDPLPVNPESDPGMNEEQGSKESKKEASDLNKGQEKKVELPPPEEPLLEEPELNKGQEKKEVVPPPENLVPEEPELDKGQEKKEEMPPPADPILEETDLNKGQEKKAAPLTEVPILEETELNKGKEKEEKITPEELRKDPQEEEAALALLEPLTEETELDVLQEESHGKSSSEHKKDKKTDKNP